VLYTRDKMSDIYLSALFRRVQSCANICGLHQVNLTSHDCGRECTFPQIAATPFALEVCGDTNSNVIINAECVQRADTLAFREKGGGGGGQRLPSAYSVKKERKEVTRGKRPR